MKDHSGFIREAIRGVLPQLPLQGMA